MSEQPWSMPSSLSSHCIGTPYLNYWELLLPIIQRKILIREDQKKLRSIITRKNYCRMSPHCSKELLEKQANYDSTEDETIMCLDMW